MAYYSVVAPQHQEDGFGLTIAVANRPVETGSTPGGCSSRIAGTTGTSGTSLRNEPKVSLSMAQTNHPSIVFSLHQRRYDDRMSLKHRRQRS